MSEMIEEQDAFKEPSGLANGMVGTVLTWAGALLFYLTCILLPLVGQAAQFTPHYLWNRLTFGAVVVVALLVSAAALASRLLRRPQAKAGFPWIQAILVVVYVLVLLSLVLGLLKV